MKQKLITIILLAMTLNLYCQSGLAEVSYSKPFLDSKNLGEMSSPNIFEVGFGWAGSGMKPYGSINLGYISINDNAVTSLPNPSTYKSLMVGGKIGFRPMANVWISRFQPIIQLGAKTTFKMTTENKTTKETEQLFSNGNTKVYEPAKITFLTGGVGFEYYLGQRFAINLIGNYDYITIEENKFSNYSATIGIRQYF